MSKCDKCGPNHVSKRIDGTYQCLRCNRTWADNPIIILKEGMNIETDLDEIEEYLEEEVEDGGTTEDSSEDSSSEEEDQPEG